MSVVHTVNVEFEEKNTNTVCFFNCLKFVGSVSCKHHNTNQIKMFIVSFGIKCVMPPPHWDHNCFTPCQI